MSKDLLEVSEWVSWMSGGACQAEGAASAKALGQGELVFCRSSEEAIVAGAEGKGRDVKEEVREMGAEWRQILLPFQPW